MQKRILVAGVALLTVVILFGQVGWAAPMFQAQSTITYPTDGMTVSGQVEVRGIATHPNMDFYQVRYAAGGQPTGDSQWQDFSIVQGQQVQDGVLGTWDTTQIPDGQYTLALAVWGGNDPNNPYLFFATNLTVNNTNPVSTPTSVPEPTELPPTATTGPTATPMAVEQPATATPRPTPTIPLSAVPTPTTTAVEGPSVALDMGRIRDGFCTGGLITTFLLSLWGLYLLAKAALRWVLRRRSESSPGAGR
jgi:hypothetical protein